MPAQAGTQTKNLWTYGVHDTAPALRMDDGLRDMDGNVINLDTGDNDDAIVLVSIGWASPNHTNMPTQAIVDRGEGVIIDEENGIVEYQWKPGDLKAAGRYDFSWEIVWPDLTVQTTKSLAYHYIRVQSPPFANRQPYEPED